MGTTDRRRGFHVMPQAATLLPTAVPLLLPPLENGGAPPGPPGILDVMT